MDYADVYLLGRATANAKISNLDNETKTPRAGFTLAMNLRKGSETKAIYRRIVVWGSQAKHLARCQEGGNTLKGRMIIITGEMDTEEFEGSDGPVKLDVVKANKVTVIDPRSYEGS